MGDGGVQQVAGLRVDDAFGFPRAAGRVQHEERILAVHWLWGAVS